ncbi:MAG: dTDP-4-dehydrorhamnose reductase [Pseudomonadales bacterium]
MNILITGAAGQLGCELSGSAPQGHVLVASDREQLNLADEHSVRAALEQTRPDLIINAGAYTQVDAAEENHAIAAAVNGKAVALLAEYALIEGARVIHFSTDFVFHGDQTMPYSTTAATQPINAYGESKRQGEHALLSQQSQQCVVIRTAWLYSAYGNNFVHTMLRLLRERESVIVVADQVGSPTWAAGLAEFVWQVVAKESMYGIYHWTDAGVASWYDFAVAIQDIALELGLLDRQIPIRPVSSAEYPTAAKRPHYSVLDKSATVAAGFAPLHWRHTLRDMLTRLAEETS